MITVVGEALVDIIVDPRGEVSSVVGGAPLNTARTVARLGVDAMFLGGISTDAFGGRISRLLDADGVLRGLPHHVPAPTTLAIAQLDESGAATYRFLMEGTSAAALTPEEALVAVGSDCRALHVGTLGLVLEPTAEASCALVAAAPADRLVMVDPNCRPSVMSSSPVFAAALADVLKRADVVKVSGDDLAFLFPNHTAGEGAVALQRETGAVVLFTDGANAVRVITSDDDVTLPVPQVPVVDTVGAGDSFSGGFLAYWDHGGLGPVDLAAIERVVDAATFGIAVAGITCQRAGADPPHANEVPGGWS